MAKNNFKTIKSLITKHNLAGYVVPSNDFFQNEYVPDHLNRLKFATNFSGSNGVAIIGGENNKSVFFTDGRYLLQASKELNDEFTILDMNEKISCDWFDLNLPKNSTIGYDPMLHTKDNLAYFEKLGAKYNFKMKPIGQNLIDLIHAPLESVINPIIKLDVEYTGKSHEDKVANIISLMDESADYLLITNPESVCWLLNIRGQDIDYSPILLCCALIGRNHHVILFTDERKIQLNLANVEIQSLENLQTYLEKIKTNKKVQVDPLKTPIGITQTLGESIIESSNIIDPLKAIKNEIELNGFKKAHIEDGLALTKFIFWIFNQANTNEYNAAEKLLEFRQQSKNFLYPSFATISAYGPNGSIIHYKPALKGSRVIKKDNFYLVDSGGQYNYATTDVTRTLHLGKPNAIEKKLYTLVLKGNIALSLAKFPKGITGAHLDALARNNLWKNGLDYQHGTGHGVGHLLSVHEGPQRISTSLKNAVPLMAGMVLSNEPGYYENEKFGIRLENLMFVKESKYNGYLEFEILTLVPFQHNLIDYELLDSEEIKWLKSYQQIVYNTHQRHIDENERQWLKNYCGL